MTDEVTAIPAASEATPDFSHAPAGNGPLTAREAARSWSDARYKREAQSDKAPEAPVKPDAAPAVAEADASNELSPEDNAAPPQEAPGETQEPEPAELPPIEPPRSWTKDEKERFNSLPRETQEYIASREQEREREVRRSQNEHAEKLKGLTAKEQQVEHARQQYETALPVLLQNLSATYNAEFADIRSMQDVQRMAREDPLRYTAWDAQQKQMAAVQQEIVAAQQRQESEKHQRLEEFKFSEAKALLEALPDLRDTQKLSQAQTNAIAVLRDIGFKDDELGALARGEKEVSVHDHRFQRILHEAAQFRAAKESRKAVVAAPKPPVQRPGVARPAGADKAAQIQALEQQLANATGLPAIRLATQLAQARRAAG